MHGSTKVSFRMHFFIAIVLLHLLSSMHVNATALPSKEIKEKQKVIIIADPGVDDAAAILMAVAHPDIEVLAVLSNFGIPLSSCTYN